MTESDRINEYFDGMIDGIRLYAHWEDGVQFVGTTGKSLKTAIENIESERRKKIENVN